jgi:GT2 family glycosyltransferase
MTPRISVVVPLYNKAPYVQRTLDSIARQTFSDFEVIVVDDGSADQGPEIVRAFSDKRVRLIMQANLGPGAARNRALSDAQGDLIAFLDADDEWLPNYLANGVHLLDDAGGGVASVTCGYVTDPGNKSHTTMWQRRGLMEGIHRVSASTSPSLMVQMLAYMSPCTTITRAAALRRWGGFYSHDKCKYAEDAYLWLKMLMNEPVAFTFQPLARLHNEASSLSKNLPGARPIEPFLTYPEEIEASSPPHLRDLLSRVLAIRALKTACVLGYWGHWQEASELVSRFNVPGMWKLPYYAPSLICRTPLGGMIGTARRKIGSPA